MIPGDPTTAARRSPSRSPSHSRRRPRVLLLMASTSYRAKDFLAAAAALDVEVVVGSDHRQVLARHAGGRSLYVELADEIRGVRAIRAHAEEVPVDAVLGADDDSVLLAARAAHELRLPHNAPDAVRNARDKLRFREALAAGGVPGPRFKRLALDAAPRAEPLRYPCVVKPRSLSGSRGVLRVNNAGQLARACAQVERILASATSLHEPELRSTALLEEYVYGDEVALEGMLHEGELQVLALFDKPDPMHGPTFEETLLVTPSRLSRETQAQVAATVQAAARALGLRQGPVHAELRVNTRGAWMIELASRSVGGLCSRTLRFEGGSSLEALILRNALSLPVPAAGKKAGATGAMMLPVPCEGRLEGVEGVEAAKAIPGIDDIVVSVPVGDVVRPLPSGDRYLGFIFASAPSPAGVERALRAAHGALRITIST